MKRRDTTTIRLLERYSTYMRRPTVRDAHHWDAILRSYRRMLRPWLPRRLEARILDVGCGEGSLLALLRELGYHNLAGFDLSLESVRICHELGLDFATQFDALNLAEFGSGSYDVIFVVDLLEHLPLDAAAPFLEHVRERLASGGSVIIRTPNLGSIVGPYFRYSDLTHQFGLTERSAVQLLQLAGFLPDSIEIQPAWRATTLLGYIREAWLFVLHYVLYSSIGDQMPRVPTENLLIRATRR